MSKPLSSELFLGIDGGGTKCCALIVNAQGETLGKGLGGSANAYQNLHQTQLSIIDATTMALQNASLPETRMHDLIAGVGVAGVNVPSVFIAMNQWQHPFKKMYLTTDLHIACLGAHKGAEGAVIIAGTGSCGYSFVNNKATILGGHGFLLGDNGSGAWMGVEAVKAVLLAQDHVGQQTLMSQMLCKYLQTSSAHIVDRLSAATSGDYAKISRFVFEAAQQNDEVAINIIREGAQYIDAIAEKLWETKPERMSLLGGLANYITPWLNPTIAAKLSVPLAQPEMGAVLFAMKQ